MKPRREKVLSPTRPNQGIELEYRRKLETLIAEMHGSFLYWLKAQYRKNPPKIAVDELPVVGLQRSLKELGDRWLDRFDEEAPRIAGWFSTSAKTRTDAALKASLRRAGYSVRFDRTRVETDVFRATLAENVSLIKSIASEHLTDVQGSVFRSVAAGRDIGGLVKELEQTYGVTRRRASLISRDQNNKATAAITRVRQQQLGITEAIWLHSRGGRHPRPSHVAASGKRYEIAKGMYLDGVWTWPGHEINCRCVPKSIIPELDKLGRYG